MTPDEQCQALEDRLDIVDLIYAYAHRLDAGEVEGVMSCFTHDAYASYNDGANILDGSAQLREFFEMVVERFRAYSVERPSMHIMNNVMVALAGDHAEVKSKALAYLLPSPDGQITVRGLEYVDEVVRGADGWKIARRLHKAQFQYQVEGQSVRRDD
jgi:ketosteroid isomerase-like protein